MRTAGGSLDLLSLDLLSEDLLSSFFAALSLSSFPELSFGFSPPALDGDESSALHSSVSARPFALSAAVLSEAPAADSTFSSSLCGASGDFCSLLSTITYPLRVTGILKPPMLAVSVGPSSVLAVK